MAIYYKTIEEIELIRQSAQIVSRTLGMLATEVVPGVTPLALDKLAETFIRDQGAEPGFLGLYGYPNSLCTSVNEQVVHGIPTQKPLQSGDIISIDCGAKKNEFYGDHAYTFAVGEVSPSVQKLLKVTKECLTRAIAEVEVGKRIGDIGFVIAQHAQKNGFSVVRELVGHGLGKKMHEKPDVPNYGKRGRGVALKNGLVIAIEPMINMGSRQIKQLQDKWTIVAKDKKPSAHFEHNVAVVNGKAEVLSTFDFIEEALAKSDQK